MGMCEIKSYAYMIFLSLLLTTFTSLSTTPTFNLSVKTLPLKRLSFFTNQSHILTCIFTVLYIYRTIYACKTPMILSALSFTFTLAYCLESVVCLMYWVIFLNGAGNFMDAQEFSEFTLRYQIFNYITHLMPFAVLSYTLVQDNLYRFSCMHYIATIIYFMSYFAFLIYSHKYQ